MSKNRRRLSHTLSRILRYKPRLYELEMDSKGRVSAENLIAGLRRKNDQAHRNGVTFYEGNEKVWLADFVPPEFIEIAIGS